jgi:hypothetical protein
MALVTPTYADSAKEILFDQSWELGEPDGIYPTSGGSSGVDSILVDDFEFTSEGGEDSVEINGCLIYFGAVEGFYESPDHIDIFIDSDGDPGPATPYGYPWTPDTWTEAWPYDSSCETLWDPVNYIYTYEIDFTTPPTLPSSTVYYWAQQYEHDRSGGDQIGTPYDAQGGSYGDESYFASDYFGFGWTPLGTVLGLGPQRIGFVLYGEEFTGIEGAPLGKIKAGFME